MFSRLHVFHLAGADANGWKTNDAVGPTTLLDQSKVVAVDLLPDIVNALSSNGATMNCNLFYLLLVCLTSIHADGQEEIRTDENTVRVVKSPWEMQDVDTRASLRGLHVLDAQNIWASGTNGTVVNSNNAGQNWRVITIAGAQELDVRDIHAIDQSTIIAMTSGSPARIYRTTDAGSSWKIVYGTDGQTCFF